MRNSVQPNQRLHSTFCTSVILVLIPLLSCTSVPAVRRVDPDQIREVSGQWSGRDSGETARVMIDQCLTEAWLENFRSMHPGKLPIVVVGEIVNATYDKFDTRMFVKELERALINSGRVGFVADAKQRQAIVEEIRHQQVNATARSRKDVGRAVGADYMLIGKVSQIKDSDGRRQITSFYQVNLELIEIETQIRVWVGMNKIGKEITRPRMRF